MNNPFTPSFGTSPPVMVGRDEILSDFREGLESGPGAPERLLLLSGLRGSGKTVLLNALEDVAREVGWAVLSETTRANVVQQLRDTEIPRLARSWSTRATDRRMTGASASVLGSGASVDLSHTERFPAVDSLRSRLNDMLDLVEPTGGGLLLTLDEIHRLPGFDRKEGGLVELHQVLQHLVREGRQIAYVAAGLPRGVADLLDVDGTTFLRRAERSELTKVGKKDVARALSEPITMAGRSIAVQALELAVEGTGGYPYLIQSVGRGTWAATPDADEISADDARRGVAKAVRSIGRLVHDPALNDLSDTDRSYLSAMAVDNGPARTGDVARRLDVDPRYASTYRARLLRAELIWSPQRGFVDFALPYMRTYLREHVVTDALGEGLDDAYSDGLW